jgi:hypothetical protein
LALKRGITVLNTPGTVDAGYRGEVGVILINHGPEGEIKAGERIAQMVIKHVPFMELVETDALDDSARGEGGFGSTGQDDVTYDFCPVCRRRYDGNPARSGTACVDCGHIFGSGIPGNRMGDE